MSVPPPKNANQRNLEVLQKKVAEGEVARERRDRLAFSMWQAGMTQNEIAQRLDRADRSGGGSGVTASTAQKLLYRIRKRSEAEQQ